MKRILSLVMLCLVSVMFVACGQDKCCKAIELMGAGDRIHDSYTFANTGVKIKSDDKQTYTIYGSVEKLTDTAVKKEFKIAEDVTHVVAIKLTAIDTEVDKDNLTISINGIRSYDAEHLNGSDYTFIILEAVKNRTVTITVKWNKDAEEKTYVVYFAEDIVLK